MTRGQKWFVLICLMAGLGLGSMIAQLQVSGGGTVSISQGGNTATVDAGGALKTNVGEFGGSAVTLGQNTMANSMPVAIASNQSAVPASQSGTWSVGLTAGSAIIGKTVPATACGATVASQALAAVPTSSTAVFSSTTCVTAIVMNNTNASSVTVTVTDNQGSLINDVLTFSIPANSQLIQPLWGIAFTSGVKWSASGTGVTGGVIGYQ